MRSARILGAGIVASAGLAGVAHAGDGPVNLISQERSVSTFITTQICGAKAFDIEEAPGFDAFEATLTKTLSCEAGMTGTKSEQVSFLGEAVMLGHGTSSFEHESDVASLAIADSTSSLEAVFDVTGPIEYMVVGHVGASLGGGDFAFVHSSVSLVRQDDDETVFEFGVSHEDEPHSFELGGELAPGTYRLQAATTSFLDDGDAELAHGAGSFDFELFLTGGCAADFNGDGVLNILDFVAFQNAFVAGDPDADCDGNGALNVLDFVCFQGLFQAGCR